jgi:hypothetical protein
MGTPPVASWLTPNVLSVDATKKAAIRTALASADVVANRLPSDAGACSSDFSVPH